MHAWFSCTRCIDSSICASSGNEKFAFKRAAEAADESAGGRESGSVGAIVAVSMGGEAAKTWA